MPSSTPRPSVFLDASVLFAAIYSDSGAARLILRLGEAGAVNLLVSSQVLAEVEGALRRKAPEALGHLALLLDRARCQVIPNPSREQIEAWQAVVPYLPDAAVLVSAFGAKVDYLVTWDWQHLLRNEALIVSPPLPIGTPGDFLEWLRGRLESH